ncbi:MAG: hypothetical protein ACYDHC_09005 [Desulfuromonadaceae bacterium]
MKVFVNRFKPAPFVILITIASLLFVSGCARYARNVNTFYNPSATVRGGSGELYVVIPGSLQTHSEGVKWVLGKVRNDDNIVIDEITSPRSPAEIIQSALVLEFNRAGYTVIPVTKRPAAAQQVLDLTKAEIELEQISDLANLKVKCRVLAGLDIYKNGQHIKRVQYESTASRTDIKDRDLLAKNVLEDALKSLMREAVPELHTMLKQ